MRATLASIAAGQIGMRAPLRSLALVLTLLLVPAGCKTTGGKILGPLSLVSAVGGSYLTVTSGATIENGMLVTHDDRQNLGVGLIFAAVLAATGWAVCETMFSEHGCGNGGGYVYVSPAPAVTQAVPSAPLVLAPPAPPVPAPPAPPARTVAPPAPEVDRADPAAQEGHASGDPGVIVVPGLEQDDRDHFNRGWRFDPLDGQDKLYASSGEFIGRIDARGDVWDSNEALMGRVAMGPSCETACMLSQAGKMLRGIPLNR
jgi:hypothetical protein